MGQTGPKHRTDLIPRQIIYASNLILDRAKEITPRAFLSCRYNETLRINRAVKIAPPHMIFVLIDLSFLRKETSYEKGGLICYAGYVGLAQ
jgi:hypothetical protein